MLLLLRMLPLYAPPPRVPTSTFFPDAACALNFTTAFLSRPLVFRGEFGAARGTSGRVLLAGASADPADPAVASSCFSLLADAGDSTGIFCARKIFKGWGVVL